MHKLILLPLLCICSICVQAHKKGVPRMPAPQYAKLLPDQPDFSNPFFLFNK